MKSKATFLEHHFRVLVDLFPVDASRLDLVQSLEEDGAVVGVGKEVVDKVVVAERVHPVTEGCVTTLEVSKNLKEKDGNLSPRGSRLRQGRDQPCPLRPWRRPSAAPDSH